MPSQTKKQRHTRSSQQTNSQSRDQTTDHSNSKTTTTRKRSAKESTKKKLTVAKSTRKANLDLDDSPNKTVITISSSSDATPAKSNESRSCASARSSNRKAPTRKASPATTTTASRKLGQKATRKSPQKGGKQSLKRSQIDPPSYPNPKNQVGGHKGAGKRVGKSKLDETTQKQAAGSTGSGAGVVNSNHVQSTKTDDQKLSNNKLPPAFDRIASIKIPNSLVCAPTLRRAHTLLASAPKKSQPQGQIQRNTPFQLDVKKHKPQRTLDPTISPSRYQATSRWNDMVQDDEIERLQRKELPKLLEVTQKDKNDQNMTWFQVKDYKEQKLAKQMLPGMANMGNTCFANSVLQCLVHTPALREYCRLGRHSDGCTIKLHEGNTDKELPEFIQPMEKQYSGKVLLNLPEVQKVMKNPHFCCFCILEQHIKGIINFRTQTQNAGQGTKAVLPLSVILMIQRIGSGMFELGKQADGQEFLFILLENLTQASFGYLRGVPFSFEKQTFIPKLFQGKFERQILCSKCKQHTSKTEDFLNLSLDLVEPDESNGKTSTVKQEKATKSQRVTSAQSSQNSGLPEAKVKFDDCIENFFQSESLDADNRLECQRCGALSKSKIRYRVKVLPRIMIVHMKRFDYRGTKLQHTIDIPNSFKLDRRFMTEELARKEENGYLDPPHSNLAAGSSEQALFESNLFSSREMPFASDCSQNTTQGELQKLKTHRYELYAMIVHEGISAGGGHYYSLVKAQEFHTGKPGKWAKFNDDKVSFVDPNQISAYSRNAYLLFYQKQWDYEYRNTRTSSRNNCTLLPGQVQPHQHSQMLCQQWNQQQNQMSKNTKISISNSMQISGTGNQDSNSHSPRQSLPGQPPARQPPSLKRLNTFADTRDSRVHKEVLAFDKSGSNVTPTNLKNVDHHHQTLVSAVPHCSKFEQLPIYGQVKQVFNSAQKTNQEIKEIGAMNREPQIKINFFDLGFRAEKKKEDDNKKRNQKRNSKRK